MRKAWRSGKSRSQPSKPDDSPLNSTILTHNNLLIVPLKVPICYDLRRPLSQWLDAPNDKNKNDNVDDGVPANPLQYVHVRPNFSSVDCSADLQRIASLRNCLSDSLLTRSHKVALQDRALTDAHEYYATLVAFETRGFPTADEMCGNHGGGLSMEWSSAIILPKDTTTTQQKTESHGSLVWDRACIVWTIAALESYLAGTMDVRDSKESCKQVVKHCQNAASMMRHLRQTVVGGKDFATVDLSLPMLQFWENVCLAQGQVAAYEMAKQASANAPKHSLLSYVAMGTVPLWNEALKNSKETLITSQLAKPAEEWGAYCKVQSMLWTTRAEFHQSLASRQAKEWGVELAWLGRAYTSVTACREFLNRASLSRSDLVHAVNLLYDQVNDRRAEAQKDNLTTYGERVPEQVPQIRAQQLVKSDLPLPETMITTNVPLFRNV